MSCGRYYPCGKWDLPHRRSCQLNFAAADEIAEGRPSSASHEPDSGSVLPAAVRRSRPARFGSGAVASGAVVVREGLRLL